MFLCSFVLDYGQRLTTNVAVRWRESEIFKREMNLAPIACKITTKCVAYDKKSSVL